MKRAESLELLKSQHHFPGPFDFRVVVKKGHKTEVVNAVLAVSGDGTLVSDVVERPSRKGTYVALVITVKLRDARQVFDIYDVIKQLPSVVTAL